MDRRKLKLIAADVFVLAFIYIFSIFCGSSSDSLRLPDGMTLQRITVIYIIFAFVIFISRVVFRIYKNIWRYAGAGTFFRLVIADLSAFVVFLGIREIFPYINIGYASTALMSALSCLACLSMRFVYQLLYARNNKLTEKKSNRHNLINIAIIGAGNIGASLANALERNPNSHYKPYCFVDTDKYKIGQHLNGLPVLKEDKKIVDKLKKMPIQEIVIAMPDADGEKREELYKLYRQTGCKIKIYDYPLGRNEDVFSGQRALRELSIEDLLQRESIKFDNTLSKQYYTGKRVLITGGGGSIGSELCRQIAKLKPQKLVIFDIYENNAYEIEQELKRKYGDTLDLEVKIGSVRDVDRLDKVFNEIKPNVVLHAAAHKHVPLMENCAGEAVKNNVLGTYNTANAAEKYGVEKFVLISTDKAVNPTNVMGATKRLCEMVIQCRKDSSTKFVAVRFGNVLGSNGSVIPLFRKQIEEGGPITITDRRIIRYFMTIPEASQLVLQAGAMAHRGELFVLNMGKPVKIYDLAVNMITLSGFVPDKDIMIKEVGLRPGEKLYEELLIESETLSKTDNELIFIEKDKAYSRDEIQSMIDKLKDVVKTGSSDNIKEIIKEMVPTYLSPDIVNNLPKSDVILNNQ